MSSAALTLYQIEDNLLALLDTAEGGVAPEHEEAIAREIQEALRTAIEKRDRVAQFMAHCEAQQEFVDAEIKRLQKLKKSYGVAIERMEGYVQRVIEALGTDEKGRYRKLEGRTCSFSLRACPTSVLVQDEAKVPSEYKTLTITVPAVAWEKVAEVLTDEQRREFIAVVKKTECVVEKAAVKRAIDSGREVPGADLAIGKYRVQRS